MAHKYAMFIYRITNTANGKVYIGQTKDVPQNRFRDHLGAARRGDVSPLSCAIRKYGEASFLFDVIRREKSPELLDEAEKQEIAAHNSYIRDPGNNGYNRTRGGRGWSADVCRDQAKERRRDGYSEAAKKRARRMSAEGTHNFSGEKGTARAIAHNTRLVAEGKHPAQTVRTCPTCGETGKAPNIFRYHFKNCPNREKTL